MSVSAPSSISGSQNDAAAGLGGRESRLGQDAFLKLLTTQLANQDPLQPQENGEFLAQLAQFSSLEKLTSIETSIKELVRRLREDRGPGEHAVDRQLAGETAGCGFAVQESTSWRWDRFRPACPASMPTRRI